MNVTNYTLHILFLLFAIFQSVYSASVSLKSTRLPIPPVVTISSHSPFDAGLKLGRLQKEAIQGYVTSSHSVKRILKFIQGHVNGTEAFKILKENAKARFPIYYEEARGMSRGSGVSFETILVINFLPELEILYKKNKYIDSCSDILVTDINGDIYLGHNEDNSPIIGKYAYIVKMNITYSTPYTAYAYPGALPGNAWGFNDNLVTVTVNAIHLQNIVLCNNDNDSNDNRDDNDKGKLLSPRYFINRDLLASKNVDDAIRRSSFVTSGFSVNLSGPKEQDSNKLAIFNVEAVYNKKSVLEVTRGDKMFGSYFHVNTLDRLKEKEIPNVSSLQRRKRLIEMGPFYYQNQIVYALGDTKDKDYPIFRRATVRDDENTLCTIVFSLAENLSKHEDRTASLYVDNPTYSNPVITFHL